MSESQQSGLGGINSRKNISSQARQIRETGGESPEVLNGLPLNFRHDTPEMREQWKRFKPEIYAITGVIIDRVISRTLKDKDNHPPFGLVQKKSLNSSGNHEYETVSQFNADQPFQHLSTAMGQTLNHQNWLETKDLEQGLKDPENSESIKKAYKRLLDIIPAKYGGVPLEERAGLAFFMVETGIGTATKVMANLLEVIPDLYRRDYSQQKPSADTLTQIATESYPLLAQLAMMHLKDFSAAEKYMRVPDGKGEWDLAKFKLTNTASGLKVEVNPGVREFIDKFNNDAYESVSETIGCPAMVNFGEGSAVKRLWNWYVDIGKTIYQDEKIS